MMRKLRLVYLFFIVNISTSYCQIIKDTIFIQFDSNVDIIKLENDTKKYIWLKNLLFEEELYRYEEYLQKIKQDSLLLPPTPFPQIKPAKYYKFFLIDERKMCCEPLIIKHYGRDIKMFDRKELKNLTPYHKKIFIVHKKNDIYTCYPVSFYHNVQE